MADVTTIFAPTGTPHERLFAVAREVLGGDPICVEDAPIYPGYHVAVDFGTPANPQQVLEEMRAAMGVDLRLEDEIEENSSVPL